MKKSLLIIFAVVALLISGSVIYNYAIPDYVKIDEVYKGYTDCVKYDNTGKDIDICNIYFYNEEHIEKFAESDLYKKVDESNIDEVRRMIEWYEQFDGNEKFSNIVSNGDYFILRYLDHDANETEEFDDYFELYYFDTQSHKLYFLLQSM